MSKRFDIINSLIAHIEASVGYSGFRGLRFLHEINSFPAFYIHPRNESRQHNGRGSRQAIISLDLRGYGWNDNLDYIEQLSRELETAVQTYAPLHKHLVHEARTISIRTDEGAMAPYCICDMSLQILYGINDE
jgi:hypothetical protein